MLLNRRGQLTVLADSPVQWPHPLARGVRPPGSCSELMAPFAARPGGLDYPRRLRVRCLTGTRGRRLIESGQIGVIGRQMLIVIHAPAACRPASRRLPACLRLTGADKSREGLLP